MAGMCRLAWLPGVLLVSWFTSGSVLADSSQSRDFLITANGKDVGFSRKTILQRDDGSMLMTSVASVEVRLFIVYRFHLDSTEYWKDGRLVQMKTNVNDNGKQDTLLATAQPDRIAIRMNKGGDKTAAVDAWTTSFWKLPDAKCHNKSIPVLDTYTGESYTGSLQYVATEQRPVGDQMVNCYHFRVTGGPYPVDLWYDEYYFLVREEFTKSGQRMVIQLTQSR